MLQWTISRKPNYICLIMRVGSSETIREPVYEKVHEKIESGLI